MSQSSKWILAVLALLVLAAFPFLGAEPIALRDALVPGSAAQRILLDLRLPRLCLALAAGGGLAVLGGTYQILFHNPLAEPYVLGVSSAVTLGAAFAEIVLHVPAHSPWGMASGFGAAAIATPGQSKSPLGAPLFRIPGRQGSRR